VPTSSELNRFRTYSPTWGACGDALKAQVTGNHGLADPTTDELIQWAAHKWGIDEDIVRGVTDLESRWHQQSSGDWDAATGEDMSYGITSVRRNSQGDGSAPTWDGTFPLSRDSTAFNLDYWAATVRHYFEGCAQWLNTVERSRDYAAGDMWGSIGAWYSGRWHDAGTEYYVGEVKTRIAQGVWEAQWFLTDIYRRR
jgi:hypothetical protein